MGTVSTVQCSGLVERLKCLHQTTDEMGLKQWLQRELEGYEDASALPWYRIIECRQRGLFQHAHSGRQQTCQINEQALSQRDLAQVRFLLLRGPLVAYLDCHALVLERWPNELLQEYRQILIPEHTCMHAWKEPVVSIKDKLVLDVDQMLQEYVPTMSREMDCCNLSLRAIQHRRWQI